MVAIFCNALLDAKPLKINGDGLQTRDFVYVGDVAEANILAYEKLLEKPGYSYFNVGCGIETNIVELAEMLKGAWAELEFPGKPVEPVQVIHGDAAPGEQRRSVISPEKIEQELSWKPALSVSDGIGQTLKSFVEARAS